MGWWRINWESPKGSDGDLMNAIPGRDPSEDHYIGDEPADAIDIALKKIGRIYSAQWGREPYEEEIQALLEFCCKPQLRQLKERLERVEKVERALLDSLPASPMCRDCADAKELGTCDTTGLPCDPVEKAIHLIKRAAYNAGVEDAMKECEAVKRTVDEGYNEDARVAVSECWHGIRSLKRESP